MSSVALRVIPRRTPNTENRILVYSPLHKPKDVMVVGENYRFDAHGFSHCTCAHHNIPGAVDNIGIHAAWEYPRDDEGRMDTSVPLSRRKIAGEGSLTAEAVADLVVGPGIMGPLGFIKLDPAWSPDQMREAMAEADAKEIVRYLQVCQDTIDGWEAHVVKTLNENPGKPAPPRPNNVREAYAYRSEHRGHVLAREVRKQFICDFCGDEYDQASALATHVAAEHPGRVSPKAAAPAFTPPPTVVQPTIETAEEELTQDEEEQPTMGSVEEGLPDPLTAVPEPPKPPALPLHGDEVLQRAERGKVELSLADRKGLLGNDPDIIADVEARIQKAFEKARAARPRRAVPPEPKP
jgi:hypothetical protein